MAIITEYYTTRSDGVVLNRTYSDEGLYIERDGDAYEEAIDPADENRQYNETFVSISITAEEALAELVEVLG